MVPEKRYLELNNTYNRRLAPAFKSRFETMNKLKSFDLIFGLINNLKIGCTQLGTAVVCN